VVVQHPRTEGTFPQFTYTETPESETTSYLANAIASTNNNDLIEALFILLSKIDKNKALEILSQNDTKLIRNGSKGAVNNITVSAK
jgi:hypothetical protein